MTDALHVVGKSVPRSDGVGFVTGRSLYSADRSFPGMLHLKMVRSPVHHARLNGVDLSGAETVPGFVRALTHEDVPHNLYTILGLIGVEPEEEFVLAVDRVRYKGEPIVAIVAETESAALEAVSRVRLDLEELPAVFDTEEALAPGAPVVTHWGNNTFMFEGHNCRRVRLGDVEQGFAAADHIVEAVYRSSPIEQAPIETTGCIAVPEANGRYTVYTNTQALYFSLDNTSIILNVPGNRLRFIGGMVGGGFGGKVDVIVEPLATLAAMKTNRPVRYVYSRSEEMQVSSTRSAWTIRIKDGVTAGRPDPRAPGHELRGLRGVQPADAIRADQARGERCRSVRHSQRVHRCLLRIHQPDPHQRDARLRGDHGLVRDRGPDGPDRRTGRGGPVDHPLPQRLSQRGHQAAPQGGPGRDPDRDHAGGGGPRGPRPAGGVQGADVGASIHAGKGALTMARLRGTGIAAVNYPTGMNLGGDPSQALIHATTSGSFNVSLAATDLGQGLRTVIAQIAAETLGVAYDEIVIDTADTDTGPHDMGTFASRATHRVGNAVKAAAIEARQAMLEVAAEDLEAAVADLETDGEGNVFVKGSPDRSRRIADIASRAQFQYGRTIAGRGAFMKPKSDVDPETGAMDPDSTQAHACTVAEVEVDTETGEVAVLSASGAPTRWAARSTRPWCRARSSVAPGWACRTRCTRRPSPTTRSTDHSPKDFAGYLMPGPREVPEIDCVVLEMPSANGPYGVKGVGEMTANSPIPAIVNAIYDACGVRVDSLPVTPEAILRGLEARARGAAQ